MHLLLLTGMSGAGKLTAFKFLEDMGYYCVDNLPIPLFKSFVDLTEQNMSQSQKVAVGIDIRSEGHLERIRYILDELDQEGKKVDILFLDAEDETLLMRYKETRRNHPLSGAERLGTGIQRERLALADLRSRADYIIDTSHLLTRELKAEMERLLLTDADSKSMMVTLLSFGFKYGIPTDADLVFDVRFLPNPYYVAELRPKTGNEPEIQDFVMHAPEARDFLDKLEDMVRFLIANYIKEGRNQLVICIGCTGGKHRSITMTNQLYERLKQGSNYGLKKEHRDIDKDRARGK